MVIVQLGTALPNGITHDNHDEKPHSHQYNHRCFKKLLSS